MVPTAELLKEITLFLGESVDGMETLAIDRKLAHATEGSRKDRAEGVVYTEEKETSLMCRLALAEWLAERLGRAREEVESSINDGLIDDAILHQLGSVTVIDPACGAGAFLVGMFELLESLTGWTSARVSQMLFGADCDPRALRAAELRLRIMGAECELLCCDSLSSDLPRKQFEIVIGNPPYIRQEKICDPSGRLTGVEYKKLLCKRLEHIFPQARIDRRCDLCLYFFLKGLSLLSDTGICCFITTGSWLDAGYGRTLRRLLSEEYHTRLLLSHQYSRTFADADVNPVITLVSARRALEKPVRFVSLGPDGAIQSDETVTSDQLSNIPDKWGSVLLKISPAGLELLNSDLFVPLGRHPLVRRIERGLRTGNDQFFCLTKQRAAELNIEQDYLKSLVKSPSEFATSPPIVEQSSSWRLFSCNCDLDDLPEDSGAGTYLRDAQIGLVNPGNRWWRLKPQVAADVLLPIGFYERLFVVSNAIAAVAHQRFALLYPVDGATDLLLGLLRCSLTLYFIELFGRHTLRQGALDIPASDWRVVPVPVIDADCSGSIVSAAKPLYLRPALSVKQEIEREDQKALDSAVAAAIGLDESIVAEIRRELLRLVEQRITRSRK